jgi:hypothetical protein
MQNMKQRLAVVYWIIGGIIFVVIYTRLRMFGPLRRIGFGNPIADVFFGPPGTAAKYVCIAGGLLLCIFRWREFPTFYRRVGAGFAVMLVAGIVSNLFNAWLLAQGPGRPTMSPTAEFLWMWYSTLQVRELIAAIGFALIIWGIAAVSKK